MTAAPLPNMACLAATWEIELAVPVPPTGVISRPSSAKYPWWAATYTSACEMMWPSGVM